MRLSFSNLNEHKFRHNFQNCLNPLCSYSLEIGDTSHYLLHFHHFSHQRIDLMNNVKSVCDDFDSMPDNIKKDLLLFGDSWFDAKKSKSILEAAINYMKNSGRLSGSLFE